MQLALAAIIIEIIVGVGAGIISAVKQYSFWDVFVTLSTSILVALPVFWLGLMLQFFFGIWLKEWTNGAFYLPISGASGAGLPRLGAPHPAGDHPGRRSRRRTRRASCAASCSR